MGWEHFNISIIEVCSPHNQGARENYYLQKYLPLLNTTFSSSYTETAIFETLTSKLAALKPKTHHISGQSIPIYAYSLSDEGINRTFVEYKSIAEASNREKIAYGTLFMFRDTNVPSAARATAGDGSGGR